MFHHGSMCLEGPVSRERGWWRESETEIRPELVERVRREIAAGDYDTPEKWEAALDRLAERLL